MAESDELAQTLDKLQEQLASLGISAGHTTARLNAIQSLCASLENRLAHLEANSHAPAPAHLATSDHQATALPANVTSPTVVPPTFALAEPITRPASAPTGDVVMAIIAEPPIASPFAPASVGQPAGPSAASASGAPRAREVRPLPSQVKPAARAPRTKQRDAQWEAEIGGKLLTWAGAFTLILAIGFLIHWSWKTFHIPAFVKIAGMHLLGGGLLVGGNALRRGRLAVFAQGLLGMGIFTLYATTYAAQHVYGIYNQPLAFLECTALTVAAVVLANRTKSVGVILLGALGGYLTPLMTAGPGGSHVTHFLYLAFLNVALIATAMLRGWTFLKPLTVAATAFMFFRWLELGYSPENSWSTEFLLVLHALIFVAGSTLPQMLGRRASDKADLVALSAASLGYLAATWWIFHTSSEQQLALVAWGMGFLYLAMFAVAWKRLTHSDRLPRVLLALACVFYTLAIPLQLSDSSFLGMVWAVEALVFTAIGIYFRDLQLRVTGVLALMLAALRVMAIDFPMENAALVGPLELRQNFISILTVGLLAMIAGSLEWFFPRRDSSASEEPEFGQLVSPLCIAAGNLLVLVALTRQWHGRGVLMAWTIDAALFWAAGFWINRTIVRYYGAFIGLLMAGSMALELGIHAEPTLLPLLNSRFASLVLLGAMYLAFGWQYHRHGQRLDALAEASHLANEGQNSPSEARHDEAIFEPGLAIIGHLVLVGAATLELVDWFAEARQLPSTVLPSSRMAEQAALSIMWAVYAAAVVVSGFVLRYRLQRVLGLLAYLVITAKVFFVDLAFLEWMPRILALAGLGLVLLGTAAVYQRFAPRITED